MRVLTSAAIAIFVLIGCGGDAGSGTENGAREPTAAAPPPPPPPPPPPAAARPSVAERLAQLDQNRPVDADSAEVQRFQERLDQLTAKCAASEIEISDMTVRARELLADEGVERSLYRVITGVNRGADAGGNKDSCLRTFAQYVTTQRQLESGS